MSSVVVRRVQRLDGRIGSQEDEDGCKLDAIFEKQARERTLRMGYDSGLPLTEGVMEQ